MQDKVMRIIAGKYRHRLINVPNLDSIKPTKDRIREAIFSSLGDLSDRTFLDLFAGSGAMGIEAISRNSPFVCFVDNNAESIKAIKSNIESLKINENHQVLFLNAEDALDRLDSVDVIYIDPPYAYEDYNSLIEKIVSSHVIKDDGLIIVETNHELDINQDEYKKVKISKYGEIYVTFLWR